MILGWRESLPVLSDPRKSAKLRKANFYSLQPCVYVQTESEEGMIVALCNQEKAASGSITIEIMIEETYTELLKKM